MVTSFQNYVTLNDIRKHLPCPDGWAKLLKHLGKTKPDDEHLSLETILKSNGLDDAVWCLRALPETMSAAIRLLAYDFAAGSLKYVPQDEERAKQAIEVTRKYAVGEDTELALIAARDSAEDIADAIATTVWVTAWHFGPTATAAAWDKAWDAWREARAAVEKEHTEIFQRHLKLWK